MPEPSPAPQPHRDRITARAVALGLVLIPLNALWLTQIEYVRYSDNATTSALFFNCITLLLVLVGLSAAVRRFAPKWAFSRTEILVIYIMLVVASALGGHDQLQILFTTIAWPVQNATPENKWGDEVVPHIAKHLIPTDERALAKLFSGGSSLYAPGHLEAWLKPLGWWALFAIVFVATMLCAMAIFRRQWDYERLNYPIAQTPLEATAPGRRNILYRDRGFWIAFGGAFFIQMWRLAHNLWPLVPPINIGVNIYSFRTMPLSAMGAIPLSSYPFSYGMAFLLPMQLQFSVWFFFWLARVEMVLSAMAGYTQWNRFPYVSQQGVGAYFGVAAFVLWAARVHLAKVWRGAMGREKAVDLGEPMPNALAVWGFLAGVAFLGVFSVAAGMRVSTTILYLALYLPIVLTLTRLRAELGLPTIELYQVGADDMLQNIAGGKAWTKGDLSVMTLYFWTCRTHRQLPMPIHGDAFRIGERAGISLPGLAGVILGASALAILAAFWAFLHVMYQVGYDTATFTGPAKWAFGNEPWVKLSQWLGSPREANYGASAAYAFGAAFTGLLWIMRARFAWWPLHPVGYLVAGSFGLFRLWLPIFVTWLIKSMLLRYGGMSAYQKARPFFFGLIMGEFSAAFTRTAIDLVFNLHLPPESGVGGL